jgi:hypothetical protein
MTPLEFLARLAVLIPPPYLPTVRYAGVFAPRSSWRALVTPKPRTTAAKPKPCAEAEKEVKRATPPTPAAPAPLVPPVAAPPSVSRDRAPSLAHRETDALAEPRGDPTTITLQHWGRLLDGELLATSSRVDWALLLRRTFGFDALRCPKCDGRMRVLATLTDPSAVRRILEHLGMRAVPLEAAPARDPTGEQTDLGFVA